MPVIEDFFGSGVIWRDPPDAVLFDLSKPTQNTITVPVGSTWSSGVHWHETHTEFLQVVCGSVKLDLDGNVIVIHAPKGASSGARAQLPPVVRVKKGARHEWSRADGGKDPDAEDVVVVERTDPDDGEKAVFFWCLNALILETEERTKMTVCRNRIELLVIFGMLDNFPVFFKLPGILGRETNVLETAFEYLTCHIILFLAIAIARGLGLNPIRESRMPPDVWAGWIKRRSEGGLHGKIQ